MGSRRPPDPALVEGVLDAVLFAMGEDGAVVNAGQCLTFARTARRRLAGVGVASAIQRSPTAGGVASGAEDHAWLEVGGVCYDAEARSGVMLPTDLPFFRRLRGEDDGAGMSPEGLVAAWPGIAADLVAVADWMRGEAVDFFLAREPMTGFAELASALYETYPNFPRDRARTERIVRALRAGAPPWPIFVDAEGFVMEGRHRIVAFWLEGLDTIPVARVLLRPSPGSRRGMG